MGCSSRILQQPVTQDELTLFAIHSRKAITDFPEIGWGFGNNQLHMEGLYLSYYNY